MTLINIYAKFKIDLSCGDDNNPEKFIYKSGELYKCIECSELLGDFLVRQPNSPKNKDWWTRFPKEYVNTYFEVVEENY